MDTLQFHPSPPSIPTHNKEHTSDRHSCLAVNYGLATSGNLAQILEMAARTSNWISVKLEVSMRVLKRRVFWREETRPAKGLGISLRRTWGRSMMQFRQRAEREFEA